MEKKKANNITLQQRLLLQEIRRLVALKRSLECTGIKGKGPSGKESICPAKLLISIREV